MTERDEKFRRLDSKANAVEELAKRLRLQEGRADLGLEELAEWEDITDRERQFYCNLIEDLARYDDLWRALI
jgi:dTDP-4-amino-4,6-dideoxygalactose transaminase